MTADERKAWERESRFKPFGTDLAVRVQEETWRP